MTAFSHTVTFSNSCLFAVFLHKVAFGSVRSSAARYSAALLHTVATGRSRSAQLSRTRSHFGSSRSSPPSQTQSPSLRQLSLFTVRLHMVTIGSPRSLKSSCTQSLLAAFAFEVFPHPGASAAFTLLPPFYSRPVQLLVEASLLAHSRFWQYSLSSSHRIVAAGSFHSSAAHDCSWKHLPLAAFLDMGTPAAPTPLPPPPYYLPAHSCMH